MMIRGLYTAGSGMMCEMARVDIISNNVANVTTTGFKRDEAIFCSLPEMDIYRFGDKGDKSPIPTKLSVYKKPYLGILGTGASFDEVAIDLIQGTIKNTSLPLDFALDGEGFFTVQTPDGVRLTRNGKFHVNSQGYLCTAEGYYVMGENGEINLPSESQIEVNRSGEVFVDGFMVDRLLLQYPQEIIKEGDGLYSFNGALDEAVCDVVQGALENSNVNPVREMVDLIGAFRAYEASQRVIKAHDDTLDKAVNEIARI
ncbi:MAG: flagellar hook-basal body protein [Tepidanaerobacteraceae bacterium]|jgi:flagellar basal-body rod protein FlgF